MRFKEIDERHERTVAEFLVNELIKFNLDPVFFGGDVYFTRFGNVCNLGFRNKLGATFEYKRGEIGISLPAYNSNKDIPFTLYNSYLRDMEVFLSKLNKMIASFDTEFDDVYDSSQLRELEKKYSSYM